jgi:hypothetical protein
MNTSQISIKFSIFYSILNGSLSLGENINENLYRTMLANGFRAKSDNLPSFFNRLQSILSESSIKMEDDFYCESTHLLNDSKTLINIELLPFINKKTEFYNILIQNETIRIQALIDYIITSEKDEDIAYNNATGILADLEDLILKASTKQEDDPTNLHVLDSLKFSLFLLYTYLLNNYSEFLTDDRLTENELKYILAPSADQNNLIINYLKQSDSKLNSKASKKKSETYLESNNLKSFEYKNWKANPDYLEDLFDNLRSNKLIHQDTKLPNFKKILTCRQITTPVIWTGNISELNYFIKLIHNINKSVKQLKSKHWEVACKCFIDADGNPFDQHRLKGQKIPKATSDIIERAAKLLI